ncbi:MAG: hypothetical protein ACFFD4_21820 [Candidatus Odinarchaeota archaeon]
MLETVHSVPVIGAGQRVNPYSVLVEDMVALVTSFAGKLNRMRRGKRWTAGNPRAGE